MFARTSFITFTIGLLLLALAPRVSADVRVPHVFGNDATDGLAQREELFIRARPSRLSALHFPWFPAQ